MSQNLDRLYELLPGIYRQRDAAQGYPLRSLLQIIAEQVDLVEADIGQMYENWFIETCEDWVVPYIADLLGARPAQGAGELGMVLTAQGRQRNKVLLPRREVANAIRYRRRKGSLSLLELLAGAVAGWQVRAVELYKLLGAAQHINHSRLERGRTLDLREGDLLERIDGPFDAAGHTTGVRRINSHRAPGLYNSMSVGIFVWRLKAYSVTKAPAFCVDRVRNHYTFSLLGNNTQLFTKDTEEPDVAHIADELNVAAPIRRRAFDERMADYYGKAKSLYIWRDGLDQPVAFDDIVPADLSRWTYRPQNEQVAVDPKLGRIAFSPGNEPKTGVWVSYRYGFSADIGGGEYERRLRRPGNRKIYRVSQQHAARSTEKASRRVHTAGSQDAERKKASKISETLNQALTLWWEEKPDDAIIEIEDSGAYVEQIQVNLRAGQRLEIRASNGARPVIRLLDWYTNRPDSISINRSLEEDEIEQRPPRLVLDGLLITGRSMQVTGNISDILIRHCTLVPGWSLDKHCNPENETEPSIELSDTSAQVTIEHSIVGSIQVNANEVMTDPVRVNLSDSILDATSRELDALYGPDGLMAHATLRILRCTVFGLVRVNSIDLAENSIFDGRVQVLRSQTGCVRFCYVPPGSRTPRRFKCQPDGAAAELQDDAKRQAEMRVEPQFNSTRYGTPNYCQLADTCAEEIKRGADDESEMGVFHDLFQPQRELNLRAQLEEFTPTGTDVGIIFAT